MDLGVPHFLIQSTLAGVVAQRLVRRLCTHCRAPAVLDERKWRYLTGGEHVQFTGRAMRAVGCEECRKTGYYGRTAIYEMLPISENLRRMIAPNLDMAQFRKAAMAEGLRPLNLSAAEQVARGVTTIEEALSVLPPV
jgi:general secretion pathway protein E